jgi:CDP-4-dehydro-6-deoxyglucose reductase
VLRYHVIHNDLLTHNVSRIVLEHSTGDALQYQAGQYLKILAADHSIAPLSIANAPNSKNQLELHIGHPRKNLTAKHIMRDLALDQECFLRGPYGSCTVARLKPHLPIIFFVRGTGFAPVKAVLEELVQRKDFPDIHLYWGAAHADDFYLQDLLQKWQKKFPHFQQTLAVSRSKDQHKLHHQVLHDYPDLSGHQIYASGAEEMVLVSLEVFMQQGLKRKNYYSDLFDYKHEA